MSIHPSVHGKELSNIAKAVNLHKHTKTCTKYGGSKCRFKFPKFPSLKSVLSRPFPEGYSEQEKEERIVYYEKILTKVKNVLTDEVLMRQILSKYDKSNEDLETLERNRKIRLNELLSQAKLSNAEKDDYENALKYSKSGYNVILKRDLDEVMVNSFNPEWTLAWDGNTDVQIALDFFCCDNLSYRLFQKR